MCGIFEFSVLDKPITLLELPHKQGHHRISAGGGGSGVGSWFLLSVLTVGLALESAANQTGSPYTQELTKAGPVCPRPAQTGTRPHASTTMERAEGSTSNRGAICNCYLMGEWEINIL